MCTVTETAKSRPPPRHDRSPCTASADRMLGVRLDHLRRTPANWNGRSGSRPKIYRTLSPKKARLRWEPRGIVADLITGGAVLEYGPTETLSPVSPMLPRPVCLCRPRRSSRLGRRGKPWLLDLERRIPARDRFAPDSPLEGDGFEPSVPRRESAVVGELYTPKIARRTLTRSPLPFPAPTASPRGPTTSLTVNGVSRISQCLP